MHKLLQSSPKGLLPASGGPCVQTPPSVPSSSRVALHLHSPAPRQPVLLSADRQGPCDTQRAGAASKWGSTGAAARPLGSRTAAIGAVGTSYGRDAPAPYKWSWQDDTEPAPALELNPSALAAASCVQDLTAALRSAAAAAPPRAALTAPSRALLAAATQRLLPAGQVSPACSAADAARFLEAYGAVSQGIVVSATGSDTPSEPPSSRVAATVLSYVCASPTSAAAAAAVGPATVQSARARDLADLLWALSELQEYDLPWDERTPATLDALEAAVTAEAPAALQRAVLSRVRDQDFLAPDLCRVVCALGSLAVTGVSAAATAAAAAAAGGGDQQQAPPSTASDVAAAGPAVAGGGSGAGFIVDREVVSALNQEIRYQLTEFAADFEAADLGRLISGMAGLRLGSEVASDQEYRRILMKAVYGKTRSLVDKASVDYALSRLMAEYDDPEARSMHYDSRWTHEELRWLPRRERDKRRILKEGWYRTQWGGWSPGGDRRG